MRSASRWRTTCEVIRKINDLAQGDTETDKQIRQLCAEAMMKAKILSEHLAKYEDQKAWWSPNPTYIKDFHKRFFKKYKVFD